MERLDKIISKLKVVYALLKYCKITVVMEKNYSWLSDFKEEI